MKKAKMFQCPHCKELSETIGNATNTDIVYSYNIRTQNYEEKDQN